MTLSAPELLTAQHDVVFLWRVRSGQLVEVPRAAQSAEGLYGGHGGA